MFSAKACIELPTPPVYRRPFLGFWEEHPEWAMQKFKQDTIYCLTEPVVAILASADRKKRCLLNSEQARAELAFTSICREFFAIGIVNQQFITGTTLNPRPGILDHAYLEGMKQHRWTDRDIRNYGICRGHIDLVAERMMGYVGWLLTEPEYIRHVDRMREWWLKIPSSLRPVFPLRRPDREAWTQRCRMPRMMYGTSEPVDEFGEACDKFLDRWSLTHLATWDIPVPQGPLLPNLLPITSRAFPRNSIHLSIPPWCPIKGTDNLVSEVQRIQLQAMRDLGIDESGAGLPRHEVYGKLAEMIRLEQTIRSRFDLNSPPPGLMNGIARSAEEALGVSPRQMRKYRTAIGRCQKGERQTVPMLKVTATSKRR